MRLEFEFYITLHINQGEALYIINSAGIAYHQNFSFVYHQADFYAHSSGVMIYNLLCRLMIYTLKRDDIPSPSAWIKKIDKQCLSIFLAAGLGFEPRQTESESAVLPLHNPAIYLK